MTSAELDRLLYLRKLLRGSSQYEIVNNKRNAEMANELRQLEMKFSQNERKHR